MSTMGVQQISSNTGNYSDNSYTGSLLLQQQEMKHTNKRLSLQALILLRPKMFISCRTSGMKDMQRN